MVGFISDTQVPPVPASAVEAGDVEREQAGIGLILLSESGQLLIQKFANSEVTGYRGFS
jgi:hypothetical protein